MKKTGFIIVGVEIGVAAAAVARCYWLGACRADDCVPTGNNLTVTCLELGLKVAIALIVPTILVWFLVKKDQSTR